jgi:hypothetical protein
VNSGHVPHSGALEAILNIKERVLNIQKSKTYALTATIFLIINVFAADSNSQLIKRFQFNGNYNGGDFYVIGVSNWSGGNRSDAYFGMYVGDANYRKEAEALILFAWSNGKKVTLSNKYGHEGGYGSNYCGWDYVIIED